MAQRKKVRKVLQSNKKFLTKHKNYHTILLETYMQQGELFELNKEPKDRVIKQKLITYINDGDSVKIKEQSRTFVNIIGHKEQYFDSETVEVLPLNMNRVEDLK